MPDCLPFKACFSLNWPVDALGYCSMIRAGAGPALEDYCIHCLPFSLIGTVFNNLVYVPYCARCC